MSCVQELNRIADDWKFRGDMTERQTGPGRKTKLVTLQQAIRLVEMISSTYVDDDRRCEFTSRLQKVLDGDMSGVRSCEGESDRPDADVSPPAAGGGRGRAAAQADVGDGAAGASGGLGGHDDEERSVVVCDEAWKTFKDSDAFQVLFMGKDSNPVRLFSSPVFGTIVPTVQLLEAASLLHGSDSHRVSSCFICVLAIA